MKRVLFLYCGGTIGQMPENRDGTIISVPPKDGAAFQAVCHSILENFGDALDVTFEVLMTKESSSMTPNDWKKIIFRIKKAQDEEKYDAVGIAHGTDTLAYTANALAFALHGRDPGKSGLRIPVCVTGSQNPVYTAGGDGRFNLENLFRTLQEAMKLAVADVMVNFWHRVLLGCRTMKVSERDFEAMMSPAFDDVGRINSRGVTLYPRLLHKAADAAEKMTLAPKFGRGVVSFELSPGLDPNTVLGFITGGGIQAMIFKSLGEGNVCGDGAYSLLPVIRQATQDYMVPILIVTKFVGGYADAAVDESGFEALKAGGIPCFDQTDVTVDVKARWLLANGVASTPEDFRQAMRTNFVGEVTPPAVADQASLPLVRKGAVYEGADIGPAIKALAQIPYSGTPRVDVYWQSFQPPQERPFQSPAEDCTMVSNSSRRLEEGLLQVSFNCGPDLLMVCYAEAGVIVPTESDVRVITKLVIKQDPVV